MNEKIADNNRFIEEKLDFLLKFSKECKSYKLEEYTEKIYTAEDLTGLVAKIADSRRRSSALVL